MTHKIHNDNEPEIFIDPGFFGRLRLLLGRPRRLFENYFRRKWVERNLERRQGECIRCGACCRMGVRCRFLKYDDEGKSLCEVYDKRLSANCMNFPMSEKDLAERDAVCSCSCGFNFGDPDDEKE